MAQAGNNGTSSQFTLRPKKRPPRRCFLCVSLMSVLTTPPSIRRDYSFQQSPSYGAHWQRKRQGPHA